MKICFLAPANSIHSYRWIKYFVDKGHEVHWISFHPLLFDKLGNYHEVKTAPTKALQVAYNIAETKRIVKTTSPDVVHVHSASIYGLVGALVGFHPLVVTTWGSDVLVGGKSFLRKFIVKYILRKGDVITCDAYHMIDAMTLLGVEREKIKLIYFGVDTKRFYPFKKKDESLREKLMIESSPSIISLRTFNPVYDIETLLKAVPLVLSQASDAKFVLVGTGPLEESLKKLAGELGIMDSVRFVGRIPNEELQAYLNSADIYVSTALSDAGIAASTAEAMACELPVVVTDSGENVKWVKDGEGGFIVPVKSPEILAERIIYLIKNEQLRAAFGKVNRKVIEERNDYYKEMAKMEEVYKGMIA